MKSSGWIGVDLDGTWAHYDTWMGWNVFGEPIPAMTERVRQWLADGKTVKVFTARVGCPLYMGDEPTHSSTPWHRCRVTGERFSDQMMARAIQNWTEKHVGRRLEVTCVKDVHMIEYWDDRAVQVIPNTGRTLAEEHEAELSALRGAP